MSLDLACMVGEVSWRRSAPSTSAHGRLHGGRSRNTSVAPPAWVEMAGHNGADASKNTTWFGRLSTWLIQQSSCTILRNSVYSLSLISSR